ncbi:MAG: plasmid maintenance protein CcdB [Zetaproteobacteria bacterium CG_4_9_14_3_um_filter_49_83]|nr:MAG: plasmid maintenance protein CcdB [Zetaproteobacteria bacterium CG1_02_49_23]PIQ34178.1 MAG: plasmid maintenance protein CcdB [Zetaproteobacteria bacterium CG17_big_fil_post_rev_8_21_14_2_50_50_13]PIV29449.1 MAG: plasmid maintenance protein CcdB [Zetaproteobacteria bacterium CG02_land_8_20_14_3_00_50_9]PIY56953.1 MAG: plasmid maintenance protein CcdB [Zetaproteobacteria bacterium CG_4_10_14_0_8_um_filter_49_80]PJA35350.1 MAG: plasmid maintenance protein CcdB [Zetaproteobacteria bacterium
MPQFDIYRNPNPDTNTLIPYLLDVQADLLDLLTTRVVAPLHTLKSISVPLRHLNPVLEVNGERLVLSTAELAAVAKAVLGEPVGNVRSYRDDIIAALDFVFAGI